VGAETEEALLLTVGGGVPAAGDGEEAVGEACQPGLHDEQGWGPVDGGNAGVDAIVLEVLSGVGASEEAVCMRIVSLADVVLSNITMNGQTPRASDVESTLWRSFN